MTFGDTNSASERTGLTPDPATTDKECKQQRDDGCEANAEEKE